MLSIVWAVLATILTERAWAGPDYGNIVLIGDSITQAPSTQLSYRYRLWKRLIDDGATFDIVGSQCQLLRQSGVAGLCWPKPRS